MHPKHSPRAQQQRRIRSHIHRSDADTFFNLLTHPELLDEVESLVPQHRKRLFPQPRRCRCFSHRRSVRIGHVRTSSTTQPSSA